MTQPCPLLGQLYTTDVMICRDGLPSPPLEQRVEAGLKLFQEGRVANIVFSGGHPGVPRPENMSYVVHCSMCVYSLLGEVTKWSA